MTDLVNKVDQGLNSLPFGEMIGAPLSACVDAQEQAAISTVNFIRSVGFSPENPDEVINVTFTYIREGKKAEITVPLLTIMPIPYIAIDNASISFKARITGYEHEYERDSSSGSYQQELKNTNTHKGLGWFSYNNRKTVMKTSISTKRDSVATSNSDYCIEATIDVNVQAKQESMPAGMAKVLEMLNQAISLREPEETTGTNK